MTAALPNPFQFESADSPPLAGQLTAHADHAAVLLSQAKATEGNAGMAGVTGTVRGSTAGTGLRVGEASADLPATDEVMAVTARRDEQPFFSIPLLPSAEITAELEAGIADIVADLAASKSAPLFLRDPSPEYLAASSDHIALRSLASNSTSNFPSSVKA